MAKSKDSSNHNSDLFHKEMVGVKRLDYEKKVSTFISPSQNSGFHFQKTGSKEVSDTISDTFESENIEVGDELFFFRPGVQRSLMRKLKRGQLGAWVKLIGK